MERRFAHDFSRVRVHSDSAAAESAAALGANAYTFGTHVVFGDGRFNPGSEAGRHLISHELAHTVQQRSTGSMTSGGVATREREADRAAQHVATDRIPPTLTPSGLGVSCQPDGEIPRDRAAIDDQILQVTSQLSLPVLPPQFRAFLHYRLQQLRVARSGFGGDARSASAAPSPGATPAGTPSGEAAVSQASAEALETHINNHPAWAGSYGGATGTPEGFAEIEANTSGADFERTDLFIDWYFRGWAALRNRPDSGKDLRTLAFNLITDAVQRNAFLVSVGLEGKSTQAIGPPRALQGALDVTKMSDEEKRIEVDAIRSWQQRQKLDSDVHNRLTTVLARLVADLENSRTLQDATARTPPPVTGETWRGGAGEGPGHSGGEGQYGQVDIDFMIQGREPAGGGDFNSETSVFFRYLRNGREISAREATPLVIAAGAVEPLEPSIGAADRFVVQPEAWLTDTGDQVICERWWVIRADPDKAERLRRFMISQHRGRIIPSSADDYGDSAIIAGSLGGGGGPARIPGVRSPSGVRPSRPPAAGLREFELPRSVTPRARLGNVGSPPEPVPSPAPSRPVAGFARPLQPPAPGPPAPSRPVAGFARPLQPPAPGPPAPSRPVAGFARPLRPAAAEPAAPSPVVSGFARPVQPPTAKLPAPGGPVHPAPSTVGSRSTTGGARGATRMSGDKPAGTGSKPVAPKSPPVGKVETATDAASRITKVKEWAKRNKITGEVEELNSRLRSSDPQTRASAEAEFDEAAARIAKGENHHVEEFETPKRPSKGARPSRISTAEKSELENSAWLKKRLRSAEDRKKFMDWLKSGHKEGDLGTELKPGDRDVGKHEHVAPGSAAAEAKVREWEAEQGTTPRH